MSIARSFSACTAVGLLLAGRLFIPAPIAAQTTPAQTAAESAGAGAALPPDAQAKLDTLQAALKAAQDKGDAKTEAAALNEIGSLYYGVSDLNSALDEYKMSLPIYHALGDRDSEAVTLKNIGYLNNLLGEHQKAIDSYNQSLPIFKAAGDQVSEANTLNAIALIEWKLGDLEKALDKLNEASTIYRAASNPAGEATTLNNIGLVYRILGQPQKALDYYNQSLPITRAAGDHRREAETLTGIGNVYSLTGDMKKALDFLGQALTIDRAESDRSGEAVTLDSIGFIYSGIGQPQNALDDYNQALTIFRAVGDHGEEAKTLSNMGLVYSNLGQEQKALEYYNQALTIEGSAGDRDGEATTLNNIGEVYDGLGEKQKALDYYNQALPILRQIGDRGIEANTLSNIGHAFSDMGEKQKALDYYNQALEINRAISDRDGEANSLTNLGTVYDDLGEKQKGLDYYIQGLDLFRQSGDRNGEATALGNVGYIYAGLGEPQKALDEYNQALEIRRATGDRDGEANSLSNIAIIFWNQGELQKALDYDNQALTIERAVGDRDGEATSLNNIGHVYADLGEPLKALDYENQALPIYRAASDRDHEAAALGSIGYLYEQMGERQKALDSDNQALPIFRAVGDRDGEAIALANIGFIYSDLGEHQKALDSDNQALALFQAVGDRGSEAITLADIGLFYQDLGQPQKALDYYNQALPLASTVNNPLDEVMVLNDLLLNLQAQHPAQAIFFGKQAVNLLQQVRGNIQRLDKQLQTSFLASKTDYYHNLADLLITQNRLPEAEQVLNLLKQQEYSDYTRGAAADTLSPLTLTPAEQQAEEEYQKDTAQLISMGQDFDRLSKENPRSPDDETKFQDLKAKLRTASEGLSGYYDRLHVLFANAGDFNKQKTEIKGDVSALQDDIADSPDTVALYTMVTSDHYRVIVITSSVAPVAREYAISEADLNRKVAALHQALSNPSSDPRPLAQDLYNILIGPVKADLEQAHAKTLVWSLDGALRYLPLAALYDGKNYLVEKYSTVTVTPASYGRLGDKPDVSRLSVVAMGISRKYEENLPALPAVVGELNGVARDAQVQGANGVLPGTILLNGQFTEQAMEDALSSHPAVVHIASHFVYEPGDDSKSYLLLAGNDDAHDYHLTVEDFGNDPSLKLKSTDLLTLSACQTGMSGNSSNGREVDGLGMTAQYNGAKAVISSLWSVNDASTGQLMSDFYKRWANGAGKVSKVEALRQAQLDLLLGKVSGSGSASGRGFDVVENAAPVSAGLTHPYYWAPFVLMGNWQ